MSLNSWFRISNQEDSAHLKSQMSPNSWFMISWNQLASNSKWVPINVRVRTCSRSPSSKAKWCHCSHYGLGKFSSELPWCYFESEFQDRWIDDGFPGLSKLAGQGLVVEPVQWKGLTLVIENGTAGKKIILTNQRDNESWNALVNYFSKFSAS